MATPSFLHHDGDVADQQGADSPRRPKKSLTPPASTTRARKSASTRKAAATKKAVVSTKTAAPTKKAVPLKKAVPTKKASVAKKAVLTKKAVPTKKASVAKAVPTKKAVPTRKASVAKKAVPTRKSVPTRKASVAKTAVPTKKAAVAVGARKAVKARSTVAGDAGGGETKSRAPRPSAGTGSADLVAGVSMDLTEVVAPPDAPLMAEAPPSSTDNAPTPPPSPSPPDKGSTGAVATGALGLSLLALALCWISVFSLVLAPIILLGVIAVIVAIRARRAGLRLATVALVIAAVALVAGIGTAAAVALDGGSSGVKYSALVPGDCLKKPGVAFETTERVDCAKPHDLEVFALVDDPAPKGAKYPGRDLMDREANVACAPQFESYVGVPLDLSQLGGTYFVPTKATWDANSRRLLCTVSAKTGQLTGSVKGTKR